MHEEKNFLVPPKVTGNFSSCILFGSFQRNKKWNKKIFPLDILSRPLYLRSDALRSKGHQGQLGQLELLEAKGNADDGHAEQKAIRACSRARGSPDSTSQIKFTRNETAPPPYLTSFPKGKKLREASLKH